MEERYCINPAYVHREEYHFFDDTPFQDEWQNEVYETASKKLKAGKKYTVLDLGCGSGFKLLKYFKEHHTIGVEIEPTLSWLKNKYPDREWYHGWDLSILKLQKYDIIICSDVIEHLQNPDQLLAFIQDLNFKRLFISTPDRSKLPENQQIGPPVNKHHLREWTGPEFLRYVGQFLKVDKQINLKEHNGEQQLLICTKKHGHR